jgi:glycine dehydrogenase subunit 1
MRYLPHTPEDLESMLKVVGVKNPEDLFNAIPRDCRRTDNLDLPAAMSEWELDDFMNRLAGRTATGPAWKLFIGAGSYDHHIPAVVSSLSSRPEFVTSYTPYQPEISQGTLQAIYEYQTLVSRLLGMEVSNASMYDGATALAEALLMALRITRKKQLAVSGLIHPLYRRVIRTYLEPTGAELTELPRSADGTTNFTSIEEMPELAAVALQSPNFFGCIENLEAAAGLIHKKNGLLIACFTEPLAFGLFKNPGSRGADIACGEGQSLGIPRSFGGPGLGIFAGSMKYVRSMPGRLVGQTKDRDGKRGFVLTLSAREQHIRREKATSNICTNNSLCALTAAMYMACLGGSGMRTLARLNYDKTQYLQSALKKAGFTIPFAASTFNEFVVRFPPGFNTVHDRLLEKKKTAAGLALEPYYPDLPDHYLLCVTETKTKEDLDALVSEVQS